MKLFSLKTVGFLKFEKLANFEAHYTKYSIIKIIYSGINKLIGRLKNAANKQQKNNSEYKIVNDKYGSLSHFVLSLNI